MPWLFDTGTNSLISPEGQSWTAVSGPQGKGALPPGEYTIGSATGVAAAQNPNFTDPSGFAWWCPVAPGFSTERTHLGIHPDGGEPGTKGCIGVTNYDTKSVYRALRDSAGQKIIVR